MIEKKATNAPNSAAKKENDKTLAKDAKARKNGNPNKITEIVTELATLLSKDDF